LKIFVLISIVLCLYAVPDNIKAQKPTINIDEVPAPLFRDPIYDGAADPTIIWNDTEQEWWIFYTQRRANQKLENVAYCYGTAIGIAASSDRGRTWYYRGIANLPQSDWGHNTFWAPQVKKANGKYHIFVTYIKGIYNNWGGESRIMHYESADLQNWKDAPLNGVPSEVIDASIHRLSNGEWKMWYTLRGQTYASTSKDLDNWKKIDKKEVGGPAHEAPVVFKWKGYYWMFVDPRDHGFVGITAYRSADATHWEKNNELLNTPGLRPDEFDQGRHADVVIEGDRAYILYFTHPGRRFDINGIEIRENTHAYRRSSLQMAELELKDGKIMCDRDKYISKSK